MTSTFNRIKRSLVTVAVIAAACAASNAVAAETTLKGINQNGFYAVVGTQPIYAAKLVAGVMHYKILSSSGSYSLTDAAGTNFNAWLASIDNAKYATSANDGFTYALTKSQTACQNGQGTSVYTPGATSSEYWTDSCTFYNLANSK